MTIRDKNCLWHTSSLETRKVYWEKNIFTCFLVLMLFHSEICCKLLSKMSNRWVEKISRKDIELFVYFLIGLLTMDWFTVGDLLWTPMQKLKGKEVVVNAYESKSLHLHRGDLKAEGKLFSRPASINDPWETSCLCGQVISLLSSIFCLLVYLTPWYVFVTGHRWKQNIFSKSWCWTDVLWNSGLILNYLNSETQNPGCYSHHVPGPYSNMEKLLQVLLEWGFY